MNIRNIAIVAHVDHGKTTLVDALLKQSGMLCGNQKLRERILDSNDLERERGITILAKCTSVNWHEVRINIVDTPGHADFSGEVERILSMVDGVLVLVDAADGPLPQTKFVLGKVLSLRFHPIIIINKVDRADARPYQVYEEVFDLFSVLDADEVQLDFPILYASGRDGWAVQDLDTEEKRDLTPLFNLILKHVPPPECDYTAPFSMLVTVLEHDPYLGRLLTGRIHTGTVRVNMPIRAIGHDSSYLEEAKVSKLLSFHGLRRVTLEQATAGDIVTIAGLEKATVSSTLCALETTRPLSAMPIDPPILIMAFAVNDSPLAGLEGSKITSRVIGDRLKKEAESNSAIRVTESRDHESFDVAGRGELQLGVLIETMRREGFELSVSRPRVLLLDGEDGEVCEPFEEVIIDVNDQFINVVIEKLTRRRADMVSVKTLGKGRTRLAFYVPSRGLIGYHGEFLADTRGTGVINRLYHSYKLYKGHITSRKTGVLISTENGNSVAYALWRLETRGTLFIGPGTQVYQGMIIGLHNRSYDLEVNPLRSKQLTNFRASGKDDAVRLAQPRQLSLEEALAFLAEDELIEATPKSLRLRKRHLSSSERRRRVVATT